MTAQIENTGTTEEVTLDQAVEKAQLTTSTMLSSVPITALMAGLDPQTADITAFASAQAVADHLSSDRVMGLVDSTLAEQDESVRNQVKGLLIGLQVTASMSSVHGALKALREQEEKAKN